MQAKKTVYIIQPWLWWHAAVLVIDIVISFVARS